MADNRKEQERADAFGNNYIDCIIQLPDNLFFGTSIATYVEQEDKREVIDIAVLNAKTEEIVAREPILRDEISAIIADIEGVE